MIFNLILKISLKFPYFFQQKATSTKKNSTSKTFFTPSNFPFHKSEVKKIKKFQTFPQHHHHHSFIYSRQEMKIFV
jgi:hypothetical protein